MFFAPFIIYTTSLYPIAQQSSYLYLPYINTALKHGWQRQQGMLIVQRDRICRSSWPIYKLVALNHTLHHHAGSVNAVALNPNGDRLISGGRVNSLTRLCGLSWLSGDDGHIVVWNAMTGEKMQVISCVYHGPIGSLVWITQRPGLSPGFAFGCADGSIHVYQCPESSVRDDALAIDDYWITWVFFVFCFWQSTYRYFAQTAVHDGPVLDLKFDVKFGRLASVGNGFAQVSELWTADGSE